MSRSYKFHNPDGVYFISFATVGWIDVFTRREYKDLFVESLNYCQVNKGLELFAWVIMTNHIHLIARANEGKKMSDIIRDLKKFSSKQIIKAIENNPGESRKTWILSIFKRSGEFNRNNEQYQFWQQNNQPIELDSAEILQQKLDYLHQNPVVVGFVDEPEDYLYSSARDYAGRRGLLDIILAV